MNGRIDQAEMRRANMRLVLSRLRGAGAQTRARLATETGLSKATTSNLIGDLVEFGLVCEDEQERTGAVGRPGTAIVLDGHRIFGIGIEINVDYLAMSVMDLRGHITQSSVVSLDVSGTPVNEVLDRIASVIGEGLHKLRSGHGEAIGIGIAAPGIVDLDAGSVRFAPNLGWEGVSVASELHERLGSEAPPIWLENDAKLGVIGEFADRDDQGVKDLLYLSADVGVGAGIIAGGRLLRGWFGFAGEVGHLPLDPTGRQCRCGRTGCWEMIVGLTAFLQVAAEPNDDVHNRSLPLEDRLRALRQRADDGDPRTLSALSTLAENLAIGLSVLIDVVNPRVTVLGGYLAPFSDYLIAPVVASLESRRMDIGSNTLLKSSRLGLSAASRGGAHLVLESVFDDPTVLMSRPVPSRARPTSFGQENPLFVSQ